jgi:hypothetical protein
MSKKNAEIALFLEAIFALSFGSYQHPKLWILGALLMALAFFYKFAIKGD